MFCAFHDLLLLIEDLDQLILVVQIGIHDPSFALSDDIEGLRPLLEPLGILDLLLVDQLLHEVLVPFDCVCLRSVDVALDYPR